MKEKIKEIWTKAGDIFLRYPMALAMALIAAAATVVSIEIDHQENQFLMVKTILTACLGISLMFAVKMLSQRIGKEVLLQIMALAVLAVLFFVLPDKQKDFTEVYAFVLIPSFVLSHLLVSFIAFFGEKRELNFWQYNKNLFINIFLTAVFTGVLVGGVMLAILAVDKLFDLNFKESIYPKTFFFFAILGSCFIFLLFNDKGLPKLERDGNYPQILKFFTQFALIPLLLIYVVILYFYFGKIVINRELPRGWVSYLILAYSVVGILALLLVHPLKADSTKSWVRIFNKVFYYSLVPLLAMLFIAIFTRILEYGYTEARYYVLALAVWLTVVIFYFILLKKATIKFVPISLFAFGMFALIFPYFNAYSVAKRSQKNELEKILAQNHLIENGKINFNTKVASKIAHEVASKFDFLHKRKETDYLLNFLSKNESETLKKQTKNSNYTYGIVAGFFKNKADIPSETKRIDLYSPNVFVNIEGYKYLSKIQDAQHEIEIGSDKITAKNNIYNDNPELKVILNNKETVDLIPFINKKISEFAPQNGRIIVDEISTEFDLGKYHIKIIFNNLTRENYQKERYYFNDAIILIR